MGMFDRVKTIFKAKAEAKIEEAENKDPIGIMKVALQEARENAVDLENAMRNATATKISEKRELEELEESLNSWTRKLDLAKQSGDTKLAENVAGSLLDVKAKLERKQERYDQMCENYEINRERYETKIAEIRKYEDKVEEAEDSFEMSSAMNEMSKSVSSAGGQSNFDKIDAMMDKVEKSADMVTATADLAETEDVKTDKKLKELERQAEIDKLLG